MDIEKIAHKIDLVKTHQKNLRHLEERSAILGIDCPPSVFTQIEEENNKIYALEDDIRILVQQSSFYQKEQETGYLYNKALSVLQNEQIVNQLKIFIETIQFETRFQIYLDVFNNLTNYFDVYRIEIANICISFMKESMYPKDNEMYNYILAILYYIAGNYRKCIESVEIAITINDKLEYKLLKADSQYNLADLLYSQRDVTPISEIEKTIIY